MRASPHPGRRSPACYAMFAGQRKRIANTAKNSQGQNLALALNTKRFKVQRARTQEGRHPLFVDDHRDAGYRVLIAVFSHPLSSEQGTYKTVKARLGPWRSGKSPC